VRKNKPNGRCTVCKFERAHPGLVSGRLARGATFYEVAAEFGLNREAVRRHWNLHVGDEEQRKKIHRNALKLAASIDPEQVARDSIVVPIEVCDAQISDWRRDVREARQRDDRMALEMADRALFRWLSGRYSMTRDLRRQYAPSLQVNVQQNNFGDQAATIERVLGALAGYPEARQAVIVALRTPVPLLGPVIEAAGD
jgi:hypothetical protein